MLPIVVLLTSAWSGQSHPPLLPDMRGWTRLAFRMRRQFGVRPRSMVRLGRTLRANFMEAEPEAMAALAIPFFFLGIFGYLVILIFGLA